MINLDGNSWMSKGLTLQQEYERQVQFYKETVVALFLDNSLTKGKCCEICKRKGMYENAFMLAWNTLFTKEEIKQRRSLQHRKSKLQNCYMKGRFQEAHPNWKGGTWIDEDGYRWVWKPSWWTGYTHGTDYVLEHHYNYCYANSLTELPQVKDHLTGITCTYSLHHIDCNKLNNAITNLILLTKSQHSMVHWYIRKLKEENLAISEGSETIENMALSKVGVNK